MFWTNRISLRDAKDDSDSFLWSTLFLNKKVEIIEIEQPEMFLNCYKKNSANQLPTGLLEAIWFPIKQKVLNNCKNQNKLNSVENAVKK